MKHILAATTALALLVASTAAFAETTSNCANPTSQGVKGQAQGAGAAAGENPAGSTCEVMVAPNGAATIQNGPAVDAAGANTASHEGGGAAAK